MIDIVEGSILDAKEDIICHQVNCQGVMGAGLALQISNKWPDVKTEYIKLCRRNPKAEKILGKLQLIEVEPGRYVANIFGQLQYGSDPHRKYTDYVALTKAFDELRQKYSHQSIAFPLGYGCGLANGDWNVVYEMIDAYFNQMNVRIYKF